MTGRQWSRGIRLRALLRCLPRCVCVWLLLVIAVPWGPADPLGWWLPVFGWAAIFFLLMVLAMLHLLAHYRCPHCQTVLKAVLGYKWVHELSGLSRFPCCGKPVDDELPLSEKKA